MKEQIAQSRLKKIKSFMAVFHKQTDGNCRQLNRSKLFDGLSFDYCTSNDRQLEIIFCERNKIYQENRSNDEPPPLRGKFLFGDDAELLTGQKKGPMVNAVLLDYDLNKKTIELQTSIVALPPIYIYEDDKIIILATDIFLLPLVAGLQLYFDPEAVMELGVIGHPVKGRTLFKKTKLLPGGYLVKADSRHGVHLKKNWQLPARSPLNNIESYIELQIESLILLMRNMDYSNSILSLTGGLDTRTILAVLLQEGVPLPACTVSGTNLSLDAKIAKALCNHYGLSHTIISLGDEFLNNLPSYVEDASRLTGGLLSIDQAHEVYFFRKIVSKANARIFGHLGNQIGRRGVEKISLRNASLEMFEPSIKSISKGSFSGYWHTGSEANAGLPDYEFLFQEEVPYTSVGNYSIGNYFVIQKAPYASRRLIENTSKAPHIESDSKKISSRLMRINDLKHRFLGQSADISFQTNIIKKSGGFISSYPINWGWKAEGGVSLPGIFHGFGALVDAYASSRKLYSKRPGKFLQLLGIEGLTNYKHTDIWLNSTLNEYTKDLLSSHDIKQSGIFDSYKLSKLINDFHINQTVSKELMLIVDIAVAQRVFNASRN